ncbi:MAG: AI-2E family transporter [Chloroflexi bacterium]|nr:AI-2E family transporter [Chloroflexota bacterium]
MRNSSPPVEPIEVTVTTHSILRPTILLASALVILIILKAGNAVAGPFLFFVFLSILVVPLFNGLKKRGLSPGVALLVMLLGITAVFVGLGWLVLSSFAQLLDGLENYTQSFQVNTLPLVQSLQAVQLDPEIIQRFNEALFQILTNAARGVLSGVVNLVAGGVMALIALAFIMLESESFGRRLEKGLGETNDLFRRMKLFQQSLLRYVFARVKLNFLTGAGVFVMLLIFGVDYALLWSVLAFFLSFIPYIGLIIAAIPALLLGVAESGLTAGVLLGVGYFVINQVIEQVIEPRIVGKEMTLSPTLTLFSVIFWVWILGSLGAMLAGPLAALMILLLGAFDDTRWLAILFSAEDSPLVTGALPPSGQDDPAAHAGSASSSAP